MEPVTSWQDQAVACPDPDCVDEAGNRSVAEPEQDGDLHYYECTTCGYATGYRRLRPQTIAVQADGTCAQGIPETVRRRASAAMEHTLARQHPPLLQIGRCDAPAA